MPAPTNPPPDVMILGGGVAALWIGAELGAAGYSVAVVHNAPLGSGQTIASQGILHGGIKYTLGGQATDAAESIAAMPELWDRCIRGKGTVDLTGVRVLSDRQYLWSSESFLSRVTASIASKVIRTPVKEVRPGEACEGLRGAGKGIRVYEVAEPVLDPKSIISCLARQCVRRGVAFIEGDAMPSLSPFGVTVNGTMFVPRKLILAAGAGNEALLKTLNGTGTGMQRRPLHMVMATGGLPEVFGHCVAAGSDKPRLTITTQPHEQGRAWYLGGQLAEQVDLPPAAQIEKAKGEIRACLPWVELSGVRWSTLRVDRAEGLMPGGSRPDAPIVSPLVEGPRDENPSARPRVVVVWPTKLVFAPLVAQKVRGWLTYDRVTPAVASKTPTTIGLADYTLPPIAALPWEDAAWT